MRRAENRCLTSGSVTRLCIFSSSGRAAAARPASRRSTETSGPMNSIRSARVSAAAASPIPTAWPTLSPAAASASSRVLSSSPMSRKIPLSSRNATVSQFTVSASRSLAGSTPGLRWPVTSPATTTARTPEASSSSAGTQARNGMTKEAAVLSTGSFSRGLIRMFAYPTTRPTTIATATAYRKSRPTFHRCTVPVVAATAEPSRTSEEASLTSPSPSMMVSSRDGSPSRLPTEVAATASVGLTTAPSANANASPRPGSSAWNSSPQQTVVRTTSGTASPAMALKSRRKSWAGTCTAVA